jgi:hypothetical protein
VVYGSSEVNLSWVFHEDGLGHLGTRPQSSRWSVSVVQYIAKFDVLVNEPMLVQYSYTIS